MVSQSGINTTPESILLISCENVYGTYQVRFTFNLNWKTLQAHVHTKMIPAETYWSYLWGLDPTPMGVVSPHLGGLDPTPRGVRPHTYGSWTPHLLGLYPHTYGGWIPHLLGLDPTLIGVGPPHLLGLDPHTYGGWTPHLLGLYPYTYYLNVLLHFKSVYFLTKVEQHWEENGCNFTTATAKMKASRDI